MFFSFQGVIPPADALTTHQIFNFNGDSHGLNGSDQTLSIPADVTSITIKMWGGGGGAWRTGYTPTGGSGGYTFAAVTVTPNETLTIKVGGGGEGRDNGNSGSWPNGGNGQQGGQGGGRSEVSGSFGSVIAGGGGGAGAWSTSNGGAGGGAIGESGGSTRGYGGGTGGTQSAGGTETGGGAGNPGISGSLRQGGRSIGGLSGSGGGGDGYYGGASGGADDNGGGDAGGGGSGLCQGTCTTTTGSGPVPANYTDINNVSMYGGGGTTASQALTNGQNGRVVITYISSTTPDPSTTKRIVTNNCSTQGGTGSDQTFTVPDGITNLVVKLWGAGGGADFTFVNQGGGGGYTTDNVSVIPSETLVVKVGCGGHDGASNWNTNAWPNGGWGGQGGGGGGGRSSIAGSFGLIVAGGGGGSLCGSANTGTSGGGGTTGQDGKRCGGAGGIGGSQSAGGSVAGSYLHGGNSNSNWSGGGGDGYYGGGGGDGVLTDGGGGSGHLAGSGSMTQANGDTTPNWTDSDNGSLYGRGGINGSTNLAQHGLVVITFSSTPPVNYALTYTAGAHGSITGSTSQSVDSGGNGTAVTAVPSAGYVFAGWSDNSTANPRIDTSISGNISVTANFSAFNYYRSITIDHTKVPNTDQSNFPVLVSGTYTYLKTIGNGGLVANASGYDVGFYNNSDCSGKMAWETETYTAATGVVNYWVKVATASHTTNTVFYMCYGNSGITTDQSSATSVWDSNYKGVWHLPNGTSLTANDSTINANNGAKNGTPSATAGQIGGAANFSGSSDNVGISSVSLNGVAYTISAWFTTPLLNTCSSYCTLTRGSNDHQVIVSPSNLLGEYDNAGNTSFHSSGFNMTTLSNGWHYLTAEVSGSNTVFYIDGGLVGTSDRKSNADILYFGNYQGGGQMGKKEQCRPHFESSHRSDFYRPSRLGTHLAITEKAQRLQSGLCCHRTEKLLFDFF